MLVLGTIIDLNINSAKKRNEMKEISDLKNLLGPVKVVKGNASWEIDDVKLRITNQMRIK